MSLYWVSVREEVVVLNIIVTESFPLCGSEEFCPSLLRVYFMWGVEHLRGRALTDKTLLIL